MVPREPFGRSQVEALAEEQGVADGGRNAGSSLHAGVDANRLPIQAWTSHGTGDTQCHGHGRVEIRPGNATQRIDAHHQDKGDGHTGPGRRSTQNIAAHRKDQEEGAHELCRALGSNRRLGRHGCNAGSFNETDSLKGLSWLRQHTLASKQSVHLWLDWLDQGKEPEL